MRALTIDEICFVSGGDGEPLEGAYYTGDNKYGYVTGESNDNGSEVIITAHRGDYCQADGDYVANDGSLWSGYENWQDSVRTENMGEVWDGFSGFGGGIASGFQSLISMFAGAFGGWGLESPYGDHWGCDY